MSLVGKKVCAYCGQMANLSKEHIFPACFQKDLEAISTVITRNGEKAISSAQTIGDVCERCNNGPLSDLDKYFCRLKATVFGEAVRPGDCVSFKYDFDKLLRFLLKIGYNVGRVRNWPLDSFLNSRKYILGEASVLAGYKTFLQILIPANASQTDLPVSAGTKKIPPLPADVSLLNVSAIRGLRPCAWSLCFGSYRFCVLHENEAEKREVRRRGKNSFLSSLKGAVELTSSGDIKVCASQTTVLDVYESNPLFRQQLGVARELKKQRDAKSKM